MIANKTQLSKILGVAQKTIGEWHKIPNFPVKSTGQVGRGKGNEYDTKQVIQWFVNREVDKLLGGNQGAADGMDGEERTAVLDLNTERARLAAAQADKAEIEAEIAKGTIVRTDEMVAAWAGHFSALKGKLRAVCVRIAQRAQNMREPKKIELMTRSLIDEILRDHSDVTGSTEMEDEYISED